jgi:translation initiation factor IF-1
MSKEEQNTKRGIVIESLPNTMFRVQIDNDENLTLAYLSGKMRMHKIRILVGDQVEMVIDPYGGKARVIKRL